MEPLIGRAIENAPGTERFAAAPRSFAVANWRTWANWALLVGSGLIALGGYALLLLLADPLRSVAARDSYVIVFAGLFALYLLSCYIVLCHGANVPLRATLVAIILLALLARVLLIFAAPTVSDDIYRYIWDGRVQAAGLSPYAYAPGAAELASLRSSDHEIWNMINRKEAITIYPPGAELFYAALYELRPDSVAATKAAIVAVDLASCLVLLLLLLRLGLSPLRVLVYAWSPLPIIEFGGSGHVEALSVLLTLLGLLAGVVAVQRGGPTSKKVHGGAAVLAMLALAGAALVKLIPLLLLAAWLRRFGPKLAALCVGSVALVSLLFIWVHGGYISPFLFTYLGVEKVNAPIYWLLGSVLTPLFGLSDGQIRLILLGMLGLVAAAVALRAERGRYDFIGKSFVLVGAYLLLATSAHPWYATWLLLFVPLLLPPGGLPILASGDHKEVRLIVRNAPALAALAYSGVIFLTYSIAP